MTDRAVQQRGEKREVPVLRLPVEQGPPPLERDSALDELLPQLAADVIAIWSREEETEASDEIAPFITGLCDVLRHAEARCDVPRGLHPGRARRAIEIFRRVMLDRLSARDDIASVLDVVELLRRVELLQAEIDQDSAERFASRLSGPDGLELIVQVAHDLRSPLTSILFLSETLHHARSGPINSVQERQLGLIYSAAFGLSQIANDLIELARGGERLMDRDLIPFSVSDILLSVNDIVHPIAEEKGLTVRLRALEGGDSRVGQPAALSRALLNLTTNALKYTDEGHVELGARALSRSAVEFSVHDTGRGLSPEVLASLFDPFRRRYIRTDYSFSSSGLGLSICRKLISLMGGELSVQSAPGEGTRFSFILDLPPATELGGAR